MGAGQAAARCTGILMVPILALALACGPSREEVAAKKAAEAEAARNAAIQAAMEARKMPAIVDAELTEGPKGLRFKDEKVGTGKTAVKGGTVTVGFAGWCDGTLIDSSDDRGKPFSLVLGTGATIEGWDLGIEGMKEGGVRLLVIPPALGYGDKGYGALVGPGKTLVYRIQLLKAYDPL